jgi:hypothetical protein
VKTIERSLIKKALSEVAVGTALSGLTCPPANGFVFGLSVDNACGLVFTGVCFTGEMQSNARQWL